MRLITDIPHLEEDIARSDFINFCPQFFITLFPTLLKKNNSSHESKSYFCKVFRKIYFSLTG